MKMFNIFFLYVCHKIGTKVTFYYETSSLFLLKLLISLETNKDAHFFFARYKKKHNFIKIEMYA